MAKVAVIFTIATFLINQAIEAMVVAAFLPVWSLQLSLVATALIFPLVMWVAYIIIYKKDSSVEESYEEQVLNLWLLIFSILVLGYAIIERLFHH
jgi:hypothetical protein